MHREYIQEYMLGKPNSLKKKYLGASKPSKFFIILYNILKIAELDCCQIIILSIYVPSTHA
jgi:hypothetical protein